MVTRTLAFVDIVRDGDSFHTQTHDEVRLVDVCAPEQGQPGYTLAKQHLETLILRKTVTLATRGRDIYGRVLADVYVGRIHVNQAQRDCGYRC
jgi:endonuclease YncB( thermonuclease family)